MNEELYEFLNNIFADKVEKAVISNGKNTEYKRIVIARQKSGYQGEKFTEKQAFHDNISFEGIIEYCEKWMSGGFRQLNAWSAETEYFIKISKKGKVFFDKKSLSAPVKIRVDNNRKKNYYLKEGEVIPPLVDMGIFSKEGKVINSMYDKYRQINKFIQFIEEAINKTNLKKLNIVDFGCGKSYLTFVVYYYLTFVKGIDVTMTGLDLKEDVIIKCRETAEKYNYDKLHFQVGDVAVYESKQPVDMVITLHACDTATDYAIYHAIRWGSKIIISVPCCQHELNAQIKSDDFGILTRYGLLKERTAAIMTDAIRANLLEYSGYKSQILEFIDFTHTPKNLLIRAVKSNIAKEHRLELLAETERLMKEFNLSPALYRLLSDAEKPNDNH
ncbi:MAG: SAM-dependent methyltransferase [Lachnospiraceae bacterium]|nr:SAM-dependent methyltransferase [Lachnospiraceae bacterium]